MLVFEPIEFIKEDNNGLITREEEQRGANLIDAQSLWTTNKLKHGGGATDWLRSEAGRQMHLRQLNLIERTHPKIRKGITGRAVYSNRKGLYAEH